MSWLIITFLGIIFKYHPLRQCNIYMIFYSDGDETVLEKKQKKLENMKKRALSSDIMRDLQRQYDDRPEEVMVNIVEI